MSKRLAFFALALACNGRPTTVTPTPPASRPVAAPDDLELCESVPQGAIADDPTIANTDEAWRAMIAGAKRSIAVAQFYVSEKPKAQQGNDRLQPVLAELEAAAARGIAVRVLVDAQFGKKYPESLERLRSRGVPLRILDAKKTFGGVQHAKFLVVDDELSYLGSANFDWRSLDHIHELGLRIRSAQVARALAAVFDADWASAGDEPPPARALGEVAPEHIGPHEVLPVLSPRGFIPDEKLWDLDRIIAAIDGTKRELRVQVMSFDTVGYDGQTFEQLDAALRRAAIRGARVRLLVSHWQKAPKKAAAVQSLAQQPGIDVRFVTIPEAASGFIPFARLIHAKYMVADDHLAWLGTSNWGGDYFFRSRNVGVMVESPQLAAQLARVFDSLASGPYAEPVDPNKSYEAPKIASRH
jgi:phosphatidylserine/phosphatidylglycerophosphate/cardiolipin synthase-like enzyme